VKLRPGEGPGHDRKGPCPRPRPERPPWQDRSCVLSFSRTCKVSFAPCRSDGIPHPCGRSGRFWVPDTAGYRGNSVSVSGGFGDFRWTGSRDSGEPGKIARLRLVGHGEWRVRSRVNDPSGRTARRRRGSWCPFTHPPHPAHSYLLDGASERGFSEQRLGGGGVRTSESAGSPDFAKARSGAKRPIWNVEVGGSGGNGMAATGGPRTGDRKLPCGGGRGRDRDHQSAGRVSA
jgi:hypothetical protein